VAAWRNIKAPAVPRPKLLGVQKGSGLKPASLYLRFLAERFFGFERAFEVERFLAAAFFGFDLRAGPAVSSPIDMTESLNRSQNDLLFFAIVASR
jgi:hypothetical protein